MRPKIISRTRRLIGASSLALIVALGGGAGIALTTYEATAQVTVQPGAPVSFADLVETVKPSVVSISVDGLQDSTTSRRPNRRDRFNFDFPDLPKDHPFRRFFDEFGDQFGEGGRNEDGEPRQRRFQAAGSGFVISADGFVVTNNHVVDHADNVTVTFDDGEEHSATIVGTDARTDLALLKIDGVSDLPFVEFADTEARIGDWIVAVGNPFGLGGTVTAGIISARGRDIGGNSYGDFLQIDAAVNSGNSGGPAFNLEGEVVGVNTAIFSPNGGNVGIAFAIPAAIVEQIINDLKDDGDVTRGYLGVNIQNVSKDIADSVGLPTARGALVTQPSDGAPAGKAGILSGDIIVEVNGEPIDDARDLSRTIASKLPGDTVEITLWRDGKTMDVSVTLAVLNEQVAEAPVQPEPEVEEPELALSSVGLALVPNADGDGLLIQEVDSESTAASKGFIIGETILEADNKPVNTVQAFEDAIADVLSSGRSTVLIKASRDGNIRFIGLPLDDE